MHYSSMGLYRINANEWVLMAPEGGCFTNQSECIHPSLSCSSFQLLQLSAACEAIVKGSQNVASCCDASVYAMVTGFQNAREWFASGQKLRRKWAPSQISFGSQTRSLSLQKVSLIFLNFFSFCSSEWIMLLF